jgi:hypothetical protein
MGHPQQLGLSSGDYNITSSFKKNQKREYEIVIARSESYMTGVAHVLPIV